MSRSKRFTSAASGARVAAVLLVATLCVGASIRLTDPGGSGPGSIPSLLTSPGSGAVRLTGQLDRTAIRRGESERVNLELLLDAPGGDMARRTLPTDLVVVLDRSGSMSGEKIVHARAAIGALIALLGEHDRFALVSYAQGARLDAPLSPAAPGNARARWLAAVDGVVPGGGTNLAAGLDRALAVVEAAGRSGRATRLILISDGLANQGDTSAAGLRGRAERAVSGEFTLSTVGVGLEFDEQLLGQLARAGTGNYHYVESALGLENVFAGEFTAARDTAASALRVEIAPAPGVHVEAADSYPLEEVDGLVRFRPGGLFRGQRRSIWVTLRIEPGVEESTRLGEFAVYYRDGVDGGAHRLRLEPAPQVARVEGEEAYLAGFDKDTWSRAVTDGALNRMRRAVAESVRGGRLDEAKRELEAYRSANAPMAQALRAPEVAEELQALDALEAEVDDAFVGAGQKRKQSQVTKQLHALGYAE